jgi:hypothetical protein
MIKVFFICVCGPSFPARSFRITGVGRTARWLSRLLRLLDSSGTSRIGPFDRIWETVAVLEVTSHQIVPLDCLLVASAVEDPLETN